MNYLWSTIFLGINALFVGYLILTKQDIKKFNKVIIGNLITLAVLVVLSVFNFFNLNAVPKSIILACFFVIPFFYMDYKNTTMERVLYITQKVAVVVFIAYAFMLPKIYNYNKILCYVLLGLILWLFLVSTVAYIFTAVKSMGEGIKDILNKS